MGANSHYHKLLLSMDEHKRVRDVFQGVDVWWVSSKLVTSSRSMYPEPERRYYRLTFHKQHRDTIIVLFGARGEETKTKEQAEEALYK